MRRMSNHIASATALTVLACGSIWGAPKLLSQLELSSVSGTAVESLSAVGLNVENITVEGRVKTDPADILDALGPARGTLILAIDVPQARQRIAALPWVSSAEIVRQLPNSLHITLDDM
jgi:cell division protein FtsQ